MVKAGLLGDSEKKCKATKIPVPKDAHMALINEEGKSCAESEAKNCAEFESEPLVRI